MNAKELILSKINATPELIDIYCYLIECGMPFGQIAEIMCSKAFNFCTKMGEANIFDRSSLSNKVKDTIPIVLGEKLPKNLDIDLISTLVSEYLSDNNLGYITSLNVLKQFLFDSKSNLIDHCLLAITNQLEQNYQNWKARNELNADDVDFEEFLDEINDTEDDHRFEDDFNEFEGFSYTPKYLYKLSSRNLYSALQELKRIQQINQFWATESDATRQNLQTINSQLKAVEEMSMIGRILGINQGMKTNMHGLFNFIKGLNDFVNKAVRNRPNKKINPGEFDANTFFTSLNGDKEYANHWIEAFEYQGLKQRHNVLAILASVPHYAEMFKMYAYTDQGLKTICHKYRTTMNLAKQLNTNLSESDFRQIQGYINDLYIYNFLKENELSIEVPVGMSIYRDQFGHSVKNLFKGYKANLSTPAGMATFKRLVDNYIIPELKRKFKGNAFFDGLQPFDDEINGNKLHGWRFPINITDASKNVTTENIYQNYLKGFMDVCQNEILGWKIGDVFYLYNMLVNKDSFGEKSFTRIFEDLVATDEVTPVIDAFNKFVSELDYGTRTIDISAEEATYRIAKYSKNTKIQSFSFKQFASMPDYMLDLPIAQEQIRFKKYGNTSISETAVSRSQTNDVMLTLVQHLRTLGVQIELLTKDELQELNPKEVNSQAFIKNGIVYLNIEQCNVGHLTHELTHLVCVVLKISAGKDYYNMLDVITDTEEFRNFVEEQTYVQEYNGKTSYIAVGSDLQEEFLARQMELFIEGFVYKGNEFLSEETIVQAFNKLFKSNVGEFDLIRNSSILNALRIVESGLFDDSAARVISKLQQNSYIKSETVFASIKAELANNDHLDIECV